MSRHVGVHGEINRLHRKQIYTEAAPFVRLWFTVTSARAAALTTRVNISALRCLVRLVFVFSTLRMQLRVRLSLYERAVDFGFITLQALWNSLDILPTLHRTLNHVALPVSCFYVSATIALWMLAHILFHRNVHDGIISSNILKIDHTRLAVYQERSV